MSKIDELLAITVDMISGVESMGVHSLALRNLSECLDNRRNTLRQLQAIGYSVQSTLEADNRAVDAELLAKLSYEALHK